MIYIIAGISSFLSGIGIGGGAVFILLSMLFKITDLNTAKTYNLLLFISVGIVISIKNFKIIKKEGKKYIINVGIEINGIKVKEKFLASLVSVFKIYIR